jgi:WD40 repeat protein
MWSWSKVVLVALTMLAINSINVSQTRDLKMRHGRTSVYSVRNLPDGKRFVSASYDGTVIMWDVRSGKRVWKLDLDAGSKSKDSYTISNILGMDLAPNGNVVAISYHQSHVVQGTIEGKDEFRIALLDSSTGQVIKILIGHSGLIGGLAFSPDGELLLSESGDSTARLWNVKAGQEVLQIKLKERGASVAFSPDGRAFAVATQPVYDSSPPPIVGLYDARTGQLLREFPRSKNQVISLAFAPDGEGLAIASGDAAGMQIDIWPLTGHEPKSTYLMPRRVIKALAFSRAGRFLASGGYGNGQGFVEMRSVTAKEQLSTLRFGSAVTALDFSPNGKRLVVGTDTGQIVVLLLQTLH